MSNFTRAYLIAAASAIWGFVLLGQIPLKPTATGWQSALWWLVISTALALPLAALAPWKSKDPNHG